MYIYLAKRSFSGLCTGVGICTRVSIYYHIHTKSATRPYTVVHSGSRGQLYACNVVPPIKSTSTRMQPIDGFISLFLICMYSCTSEYKERSNINMSTQNRKYSIRPPENLSTYTRARIRRAPTVVSLERYPTDIYSICIYGRSQVQIFFLYVPGSTYYRISAG
jgi:hypothetical protein